MPVLSHRSQCIRHDIYPARGRKLISVRRKAHRAFRFATIFTPQGDGNTQVTSTNRIGNLSHSPRYLPRKGTETVMMRCSCVLSVYEQYTFATIFTPQGDGNDASWIEKFIYYFDDSPRYLPRKGTETFVAVDTPATLTCDSPRYLPRKGTETS